MESNYNNNNKTDRIYVLSMGSTVRPCQCDAASVDLTLLDEEGKEEVPKHILRLYVYSIRMPFAPSPWSMRALEEVVILSTACDFVSIFCYAISII